MASVADVLLPIAGGIAGMNPYLGSGLRTGLTVAEALERKKWKEQEEEQRQEEAEAEAAEKARMAEEDRAFRGELEGLADEMPQQYRSAYRYQVRQNPQKALDWYKAVKEKEMEQPERFFEPDEVGAIGESLLEQVGPNGVVNWSGKVSGGTGNLTFRNPESQTVAEAWAPEPKLVPGHPYASYYQDPEGNIQYQYDDEARSAFAKPEKEGAIDPDELREARMDVLQAQAKVDDYIKKKEAGAGMTKTMTGEIVNVEPDLDEDSTYIMLMQEVEDATARLDELKSGFRRPKNEPQETSQTANQAEPPTVYYDATGNRIQR